MVLLCFLFNGSPENVPPPPYEDETFPKQPPLWLQADFVFHRLDSCGLTAKACEALSCSLGVNRTLRELYLTHNALGDTGVRLLCKRLSHAGCPLRVLWLFGMALNPMTHRRLAALRVAKPSLDLGC